MQYLKDFGQIGKIRSTFELLISPSKNMIETDREFEAKVDLKLPFFLEKSGNREKSGNVGKIEKR